jgi:hypothetical protein
MYRKCTLPRYDPRKIDSSFLQPAVADWHLGHGGINTTEGGSLAVGKVVHGVQSNVQPSSRVIDGEDVDRLAVVRR